MHIQRELVKMEASSRARSAFNANQDLGPLQPGHLGFIAERRQVEGEGRGFVRSRRFLCSH